jgi:hypothetical protein
VLIAVGVGTIVVAGLTAWRRHATSAEPTAH